jgi:hypothetical protein
VAARNEIESSISARDLNLLLLLIVKAQVPPGTGIYFWSSLVWFAWYWYARSFRREEWESIFPQESSTMQVGS